MSSAVNTLPCGGLGNTADGCTEIFPRAPPGLLCQKCQKIKAATTIALQTLKSCQDCGVCGSMIENKLCGTCRRKALEDHGEEDADAAAAKLQRHDRIQRSLGRPLQNVSNMHQTGAATSLQELETLRTASQKGNWTIFVTPRRGKSLDGQMGNATFIMPGVTPMQVALQRVVEHFDLHDDCSLRFAGNISMDLETEDMTIQEVYTSYQKRPDRGLVVNETKKHKLPKGSSMIWELAINENRYNKRLQRLFGETESVLGTKRKSTLDSSAAPKRSRAGQILTSSFSGEDDDYSVLHKAPPPARTVSFTIIRCKPDGHQGRQTLFEDLDPKAPTCTLKLTGKIEENPLILSIGDRGKSKDVFKLFIENDNQVYVAKRFFDVGKGRGIIPRKTNRSLLSRDLIRIGRMRWFYREFEALAADKGFNELSTVTITEAFMILIQPEPNEDTAIAATVFEAEELEDALLVEPFRTSSVVTKFSGTLGSSVATDKLTSTVLAFSHFVLENTACLLAFADLQGSRHQGSLVLFDPMTHTIGGKSGLGDHGPKGIRDTIDNHSCNAFCKALDLVPMEVLVNSLQARIQEYDKATKEALVEHGDDSDSSG
ncbi:kinase-like domain-containing protein [Mycena epipterygia]|nr:kinase-like domain-containing protein [Mycena epipterygia]